VQGCG